MEIGNLVLCRCLVYLADRLQSKDRIVAFLKPGFHAHDKAVAFLFRRVRAVFCPTISIRNRTVAPEMGHLRLSPSVFDGQASYLTYTKDSSKPEEPVRLLRFWPDQYFWFSNTFLTKT